MRKKKFDLQHISLTMKAHSVTLLALPNGLYKDFVSICITHQKPLKQNNTAKVAVNVRKKRSFTQCAISDCCICPFHSYSETDMQIQFDVWSDMKHGAYLELWWLNYRHKSHKFLDYSLLSEKLNASENSLQECDRISTRRVAYSHTLSHCLAYAHSIIHEFWNSTFKVAIFISIANSRILCWESETKFFFLLSLGYTISL